MSNVFVIDTADAELEKEPVIAWENKLSSLSVTGDNPSKLKYLYDGLTTIAWPAMAISSQVLITAANPSQVTPFNYIAIVGANWRSSSASVTVSVDGVIVASLSGLRDNQPVFVKVDDSQISGITGADASISFSSNTNLEVGEIYIGEVIPLPRNASVGYQPGRWSNKDKISHEITQGNQFGRSTIEARGVEENFSVNLVETAWMDTVWQEINFDARGYPMFFLWNKNNKTQAVYGNWTASDPSFDSSFYSSISMTIKGVV